MDNIDLYKEFYFREIDRKHVLNNAVNIPMIIVSAIISIHFYLFSQDLNKCVLFFGKIVSGITLILIIISIFFLLKSFSNFFKSHSYREMASMEKVLKYEKELLGKHTKKDALSEFKSYLKDEFAACSTHYFKVNKNRTEDIARAKKFIFSAIITTVLFSVVYLISII